MGAKEEVAKETTCPEPSHYAVSQAIPLVQIGDHGDQSFVLFPAVLFQAKRFGISNSPRRCGRGCVF